MAERTAGARTIVQLTGTLVSDFDLVELLTELAQRCVDTLGVSAAGVMLAGPAGDLHAVASSSEAMRMLELFELQSQEGPCLDCYATGLPVSHQNLDAATDRWPRFAAKAREVGFSAVQALPLRLRDTTIGALNLFHIDKSTMRQADVATAQVFANFATIAILQHRIAAETQILNDQLNNALTTRIVIEQAKGVIAERLGLEMEQAFSTLRKFARNNNLRLAQVCNDVIDGRLTTADLAHGAGMR